MCGTLARPPSRSTFWQSQLVAKRQKHTAASAGTPATVALTGAHVPFTVHHYQHDPTAENYGLEAAHAFGVSPGRVFKTLIAHVDDTLTVAIVPVAGTLDLKALASACGSKRAIMADSRTAERATGYVIGGISPLGQRTRMPAVIDTTVRNHPTIFISGGKRG